MSKTAQTSSSAAEGGEPLLPSSLTRSRFRSTSTGSMELVGITKCKPTQVSDFEARYRQPAEDSNVTEMVKEVFSKKRSKFSCKRILFSNFPILAALKRYKVLHDLPSDLVSGLTSGIMMIPQGMAFAPLSTLDPIIGLYICFFSSLTYFILGTGQQTSFGCIAILSIMMGSILDRYETRLNESVASGSTCTSAVTTALPSFLANGTTSFPLDVEESNASSSNFGHGVVFPNTTEVYGLSLYPIDVYQKKLELAGSITLLCGIIFVCLGKIGFGRVTVFMSDSLVTGVTVGAAFHVGSSQLKTMFGLTFLPRYRGIFKLMKLWYNILANIHHSNVASLIAAAICILIIYLVKRFVNEKYKEKMRVPVPIELFVLILATVVCYFANLNEKFEISIVKDVPVGVPVPHLPDISLGTEYLTDGLIIIMVAFAQTVAVAKLMGLKHNYKVDPNQEMFALGIVNIVCSMFSGYISGASVSRTVVQDGAGGKTQIASLFAALLVLLVMLFIGPYFYYVPKISLSAIIIVSLRSLVLKLFTVRDMWHKSKVDCLIFVITVAAVVILDADIGLLVGVMMSIFIVLIQTLRVSVDTTTYISMGEVGVWRSKEKYYGGEDTAGIRIVRINFPLYFVNAEITTNAVFKKTGLNPLKKIKTENIVKSAVTKNTSVTGDEAGVNGEVTSKVSANCIGTVIKSGDAEQGESKHQPYSTTDESTSDGTAVEVPTPTLPFNTLILDLSCVSFMDLMGVKALEFLITKYASVGIEVYAANVSENCLDTLQKSGFMAKHGDRIFLTIETVIAVTQSTKF